MEKKRGIKSLFNLFDLVVIVIVLILGAVYVYMSRDTSSPEAPASRQIRYVIETNGVAEGSAALVAPGSEVVDRVKKYNIGVVESVEAVPALKQVPDYDDNIIRRAPVPGQESLLITITAPAVVSGSSVLVDGGYELRVGSEASIKVPGFSAAGYVVIIERSED